MENNKTITLTNDFEIIKYIYFCIYQIIYNITVILYEFDYHYERNNYSFIIDNFNKFTTITIDNRKYFLYGNDEYYRDNNILYMIRNNKTYWIDKNVYYVKSNDVVSEDTEKIFNSVNNRFFSKFNIVVVLNSIAKIINKFINYNNYVTFSGNKIQFLNDRGNKTINLNFFFYSNNGFFYVKELWEIIPDIKKENILNIGMNLMYLFKEFSSISLRIKTNSFSKKLIL